MIEVLNELPVTDLPMQLEVEQNREEEESPEDFVNAFLDRAHKRAALYAASTVLDAEGGICGRPIIGRAHSEETGPPEGNFLWEIGCRVSRPSH